VTVERDIATLVDEIRRYLAAVDVFRAEGAEPRWLPEPSVVRKPRRRVRRAASLAP
jgi:hypothetical protein